MSMTPPHRSPEGEREASTPVRFAPLKLVSLLLGAGLLGELLLGGLFDQRPAHEVTWQGPAERPPVQAPPPAPVPELKPPIRADALQAPSAPRALQPPPSTPSSEEALPPLPDGGWAVLERGALTAPITALTAQLSSDARWAQTGEGVWSREDAGATLAVSEAREGRILALTLTFGERGSSAIMPEIETLTLGGGSPSMTRWERTPSDRDQKVGGRLSQALIEGGERVAYYLCDYGAVSAKRTLPERCVFSLHPTAEALSIGEALRPAPRW